MTAARMVLVEALDGLAADDADAMRSRRDLQRVHRAMGTRTIVRRALCEMLAARRSRAPLRILELGAGDGSLMLGVARALPAGWPPVALTLLDRQPLVPPSTLDAFASLRWSATPRVLDVMDWAASRTDAQPPWDLIVANLFLHHFEGPRLATLLAAIAGRGQRLLACEPRRSVLALAGSHLIGALGVNAVTRADAVLSVRAGFRGHELTALWSAGPAQWRLQESAAGLFSHRFSAVRVGGD